MKNSNTPASLGVVIGRFQVDDLHEGHLDLLSEVAHTNTQLLIIIGLSPCRCTVYNPLDYDTRIRLLLEYFPQAKIAYINDVKSDVLWSETLDTIVSKYAGNSKVTLYGCRDSFIKYYHGKFPTQELLQRVIVSGSSIRKRIAEQSQHSKEFRAGAIWYAQNQYPQAIPTVDIAILNKGQILLGKKAKEDKYRLIGGFAQPGETYEISALRELFEETALQATNIMYESSFFINDWRYKNEVNKITTLLFSVTSWNNVPKPGDDIHELQWFKLSNWACDQIVEEHLEMFSYLVKKYGEN